jgi:hypothetical protein
VEGVGHFSSLRFCPCIWSVRGTIRKTQDSVPTKIWTGHSLDWSHKRAASASALGEISFYIYTFFLLPPCSYPIYVTLVIWNFVKQHWSVAEARQAIWTRKYGFCISWRHDLSNERKICKRWGRQCPLRIIFNDKQFWEELIAYFLLIRHRPHIKRRVQQF